MAHAIIAIDPDVDKSGYAIVENGTLVDSGTLEFHALLGMLRLNQNHTVVVEAGYLNKPNFHKGAKSAAAIAQTGMRIGANHQTGKLIVHMAKAYSMKVIEQSPLKKGWKGPDGKITYDELAYFVPGLPSRTNQEVRDAVLLAWYHAGLPIKIKVQTLKKLSQNVRS